MNHTNLTDAIGQLAAAAGYGFHTADERYMSQTITSYPVMWLAPPQFDSMEGLRHGRMTYAVTRSSPRCRRPMLLWPWRSSRCGRRHAPSQTTARWQ